MAIEKKSKTSPESIVREIKRKTRRKFTAEEKIRIILEGLRGGYRAYQTSAGAKASSPASTT